MCHALYPSLSRLGIFLDMLALSILQQQYHLPTVFLCYSSFRYWFDSFAELQRSIQQIYRRRNLPKANMIIKAIEQQQRAKSWVWVWVWVDQEDSCFLLNSNFPRISSIFLFNIKNFDQFSLHFLEAFHNYKAISKNKQ